VVDLGDKDGTLDKATISDSGMVLHLRGQGLVKGLRVDAPHDDSVPGRDPAKTYGRVSGDTVLLRWARSNT
jgi:hypothetical protein